ncbi:hypothetical protein WG66_009386 [Moniliophthora roreri]|uniref:Uncharacterized protein n=1 Tax=Moniliophthora roreri TaxID=221103 RepID=A0A0W0G365_MONRR|nr:hypothetical protein WG66_009386 [Moniliophthora roreri]
MSEGACIERTVICDKCQASVEYSCLPSASNDALRSDYAPSAVEVTRARAFIKEGKEMLKLYDRELERIRGVQEKLETDRASLQQRIEEHTAMISPLRRIPAEVMQRIFSLVCLPEGEEEMLALALRIQSEIRAPAYQISLTSSHWRNIVLNYPLLWRSFSLDLLMPWKTGMDPKAIVAIYLKNAGTSPLKIVITDSGKNHWDGNIDYKATFDTGMAVFRMLLAHADQFGELIFLDVSGSILLKRITGTPNINFPLLHTFYAGVDMEDVPFESTLWFWRAIGAAPRLKHLQGPLVVPEVDTMPYNQLTSLDDLYDDDHPRLLRVIPKCRNLERLSFRWSPPSDENVAPIPCELKCLRELSIRSTTPEFCRGVLNNFHAPNLTSMSLSALFQMPHEISQSFLSTIRRFSDTLRDFTLNIVNIYPNDTSMTDILAALPNLSYFSALLSGGGDEQEKASPCISHLLASLTIPSDPSPGQVVAPKLTKLFLHENNTSVDSDVIDRLLTMLESRSQSTLASSEMGSRVATLHEVEFTYWKPRTGWERSLPDLVTPGDYERIRALEADGTTCTLEERWEFDGVGI